MTSSRRWARAVHHHLVRIALALAALAIPARAGAEKIIAKEGDWDVYTDGRVGGFVSWAYGDGYPLPTYGTDPATGCPVSLYQAKGGGWAALTEKKLLNDPNAPTACGVALTDQGTLNMFRVRTGFIGNQLGLGVRNQLTDTTKILGYIQIWAFIESEGRQKNRPNYADVRQGYVKVEAPWGSVLVGRSRGLFSRGATDIDALYAHRYGVGFPAPIDSNGPTLGQIGFGVLGSGFSSGVVYATPVLAGLQLTAGLFDPIQLQGNGSWFRTKYLRPEGELTFERTFGATGKVVLFGNGGIQKVYKDGFCPQPVAGEPTLPCEATAGGVGYGGRFEYGPLHVGVAGHFGTGLGLNYALEVSDASTDPQGNLRDFDGYYGQLQVALGTIDLFTGAGISRVFLTDADKEPVPDPTDPTGQRQIPQYSAIKYQLGINGGAVYHVSPALHIDLDYFRAQARWYYGEQQVIHAVNGGMTFNW